MAVGLIINIPVGRVSLLFTFQAPRVRLFRLVWQRSDGQPRWLVAAEKYRLLACPQIQFDNAVVLSEVGG